MASIPAFEFLLDPACPCFMAATTVVILTGLPYHSDNGRSSIEAVEQAESKIFPHPS